MNPLSREELRALMESRAGLCVSIFMPTHRSGTETRQDPIRLRNLLRQAEERLLATGERVPQVKQLLLPAQRLMEDSYFWRHLSDGLAMFLAPNFSRHYRLPLSLEELVVVANRFHIKPVLPLLRGDERFFVLALSQNTVRLFQGTRHSVAEVELPNVPEGLARTLQYDDYEKQVRFRAAAPVGGGQAGTVAYGSGDGVDDSKLRIGRYFRLVDDSLHQLFRDEHAPMVLAGVDYVLPIFRETSRYPHLMAEVITGNADDLSADELHRRAWPIVQPHFRKTREEAAARYRQLAGSSRASNNLRAIVPAAFHGRVGMLFVAVGTQKWGAFDREAGKVVVRRTQRRPGDEDLLDLAALHTLLNGGTVYALEADRMPDPAPIAAVLRY